MTEIISKVQEFGARAKTFIFHLIAVAIRWNSKQVWKGLGCGEGKNLSLKGFHLPAF
ncbi:MAG: hypothetical protein WAX69_20670 [Victivallales bacterium]